MDTTEVAEDEIPNEPISAFHITRRDMKKAYKVRKLLAMDAPGDAGEHIRNVPIKVAPRMRKNHMLAMTSGGTPVLDINLKSGAIKFVL